MDTLLSLPQRQHFVFDSGLDLNVRESFRAFGDQVFAGVHWTSWQRDQASWNSRLGRFGAYGLDFGFLRTVPRNLTVVGGTEEIAGGDPLVRVAVGDLSVGFELAYAEGIPIRAVEVRLYKGADGTFVSRFVPFSESMSAVFSGVAAGSYLIWARCYDSGAKVPKVPLGLDAILADPKNAGEWSVLRVVVGSGAFAVGTGVCPGPGCPLYYKEGSADVLEVNSGNIGAHRLVFDVLARSVSASCVTDFDIERADGSVDVAAGSQIIAGLRASRNGPQSALWVLNSDLTTRLLATTEVFSNGMCECGKSDHHASDVAQAADGTLYLLSECSLHLYAPDGEEKLPGSPAANGGHPGGQCLRFQGGHPLFSTELLEKAPTDLGVFFYDRLVERPGGKDRIGCGTIWHGPGNTEIYRGRLWGFRGTTKDLMDSEGRIYFDSIVGGVWSGAGVAYTPLGTYWRQLRRRGDLLFWFGFDPQGRLDTNGKETVSDPLDGSTDLPICAVCDGEKIRRTEFDFLVNRATRCLDESGRETLLLVGNDGATGRSLRNGGRSLQVVELPSPGPTLVSDNWVCAFWNESAGEFRLTQSDFVAAGGDLTKLPAYFGWKAKSGSNGGGVWEAKATVPGEPYLRTDLSGGSLIKLKLVGTAPYDLSVWGLLCFAIGVDGNPPDIFVLVPGTTATNAEEALDVMPEGTKWRVIQREVPSAANPLSGVQLTDLNPNKELTADRDVYPTLWGRKDSSLGLDDLSSYTQLLSYGRVQGLDGESLRGVDVVVLVSPGRQPCRMPGLMRRF